jgi:cell fate regulator YaaT (PSP1 superfamily)
MIDVVGICFNDKGRIYYFSPSALSLEKDMNVIVETERGMQYGKIVISNKKVKKDNLNLPLKRIVRIATKDDDATQKNNLEDNLKALKECNKLVKKHNLNMKLIDASFTFDRKQLLFHFIADNRIDFRELAKELAAIYKTRIELRQIGVRDKAKEVGGLGPCGRLLCCSRFLYNFDTVSINMAKNQNIALNPNKINGSCGRLLCCLTYENDLYIEAKKDLPQIGQKIETANGEGQVISVDILGNSYKVQLSNEEIITIKKE